MLLALPLLVREEGNDALAKGFNTQYGEYIGAFEIQTLWMMEGGLPVKAQALVQEWAAQHTEELLRIWNTQEFIKLPPLE